MKHADNDNTDPWQSLSRVNERVTKRLLKLDKTQDEQSESEPDPGDAEEKHPDQDREYIEHRLKKIRAWERRIRGRN